MSASFQGPGSRGLEVLSQPQGLLSIDPCRGGTLTLASDGVTHHSFCVTSIR